MDLRRAKAALLRGLRRCGAHEGGAALVIAGILFPVVIGGMGLGAETGYWYYTQRMLQHAADVSVYAGAVRKRAGDPMDKIEVAALYVATASGYESDADNTHVVNIPPASGAHAGDASAIEVLITDTRPRLLSSIFSNEPVVIEARAVARLEDSTSVACVLALSKTASAAASAGGSTIVDLKGCEVASNSNASDSFSMTGSAQLTTPCVYAVGQGIGNPTLTRCPSVVEYANEVADPYASVVEPSPTYADVPCSDSSVGQPHQTTTVTPTSTYNGMPAMRFCKGLTLKGEVHFEPGLYIVEGGKMSVGGTGATVTGGPCPGCAYEGVTFLFTNGGSASLTSQGVIDIAAPTSGPLSGIGFFGSRSQVGVKHTVAGASGSKLQGAIYMPASALQFAGGSGGLGGCTQVIADTIEFTGGSTLDRQCDDAGTKDIVTNQVIKIVE